MKKALFLIISLIMTVQLALVPAVGAATELAVEIYTDEYIATGDELYVTVDVPEDHVISKGSLVLVYDSAKLTLTEALQGEFLDDYGFTSTIDTSFTYNGSKAVKTTFSSSTPTDVDGGSLLELTFETKAEGNAEFSLVSCELYDDSGNKYTVNEQKAITVIQNGWVDPEDGIVSLTLDYPDEVLNGGEFSVEISLPYDTAFSSGSFVVTYDSAFLELVKSEAVASFWQSGASSVKIDTSYSYNGAKAVKITFPAVDTTDMEETLAFSLTFKATAMGDEVVFSVVECLFYDGDSSLYQSEGSEETISIVDTISTDPSDTDPSDTEPDDTDPSDSETEPDETTSETSESVTTTTAKQEVTLVYGDANGDGETNSIDATIVLRYDAGLVSLEGTALASADVNGDGEANSIDATYILRFDSGLIEKLPV